MLIRATSTRSENRALRAHPVRGSLEDTHQIGLGMLRFFPGDMALDPFAWNDARNKTHLSILQAAQAFSAKCNLLDNQRRIQAATMGHLGRSLNGNLSPPEKPKGADSSSAPPWLVTQLSVN